jgi:tRNA A-37 threonylcarbamoyl transferase component Bud32
LRGSEVDATCVRKSHFVKHRGQPSSCVAPCPSDELLAAFATGELHGPDLPPTEEHVSFCDVCLLVLAAVLQGSSEVCDLPLPDAPPGPPGSRLCERFEVAELIAEGGMGRVYSGLDLHTGERVAIKHIRTTYAAEHPESLLRFAREAEILGRLAHPNIVRRIAMVEAEQRWHIVMEYVPGGSLRDLLRRSPRLPLGRALQIALEVADALARAHHLGVVHRDLKPENVLLAADGTPRLSDFGLARGADSSITHSGVVLGTLAYVSPEALSEGEVDARADLWALGVILFEMLSGERPFTGGSAATVLSAILYREPHRLTELCPNVPAALLDLLRRLLAKDPLRRVKSARQVGAELEAIAGDVSAALRQQDLQRAAGEPAPVAGPAAAKTAETRKPQLSEPRSAHLAQRSALLAKRVADRC